MSSSMNAWVERHATTARLACASSTPSASSRWALPSPLFPTSTRGLDFLPGRSSTARTALTATSLDRPTDPRAPRFHRLAHGHVDVGQESADLVAGPRASRTPPRLTPPTTTSTIPTTPHTPAAYTGPCRGGYGRTEQLLRRRGVDGLVI